MNYKSINFKIVVWFSAVLFFATALIFSTFYIVTIGILFREVDKELLLHSNNPVEFDDIPGMVVTILDEHGNIKQSSIKYDTPFVSYKYLYEKAKENLDDSFINQNISNTPMRFLIRPVYENDVLEEVLLIAHPIQAIEKSLNLLLVTLGAVFVVLIFPTILGAKLMANKIIKPISDIADSMDRITSKNLHQRIKSYSTKDEVEKLTNTFNNLLDRLEESFSRERQFIGDVAHELKTPVATMRSNIEITLSKNRPVSFYRDTLNETLSDIERVTQLTKNILDLALISAGKETLVKKEFYLSEMLNELKEISVKLGTQKNIKIISDIKPHIVYSGDEIKLSRSILNIIDNAIKYSDENGKVLISLQRREGKIEIKISDNGIGINKNDIKKVFNRFYRGENLKGYPGSGLGLTIAQGIVRMHKGELKIKSTAGEGTEVTILL